MFCSLSLLYRTASSSNAQARRIINIRPIKQRINKACVYCSIANRPLPISYSTFTFSHVTVCDCENSRCSALRESTTPTMAIPEAEEGQLRRTNVTFFQSMSTNSKMNFFQFIDVSLRLIRQRQRENLFKSPEVHFDWEERVGISKWGGEFKGAGLRQKAINTENRW